MCASLVSSLINLHAYGLSIVKVLLCCACQSITHSLTHIKSHPLPYYVYQHPAANPPANPPANPSTKAIKSDPLHCVCSQTNAAFCE